MPPIISLALTDCGLWASGPEGLLLIADETVQTVLQPQEQLYCSHSVGKSVFVGGLPHGIALSPDNGVNWHTAEIDAVKEPILSIAAHPQFIENGVMLAGTAGAGILRTDNRGWNWNTCNFGLENFNVLNFAWSPPMATYAWPRWDVVFAATEDGLYRSPNGGLGWQRCKGVEGIFQTVLVSPDFHRDGLVLAGSDGDGLWISTDGGRQFEQVPHTPQHVNALAKTSLGWLLSDDEGLYRSLDGVDWNLIPDTFPALILLDTPVGIWEGTEEGVNYLSITDLENRS